MPEMEIKRKGEEYSVVPAKKTRHEISVVGTREKAVVTSTVPRTSNLYAPIMLLEGHQGEIFTAKFHPEGKHLASAGFDRQIFLWNVYGQCDNVMVMKGHTGAIMELCFSPDGAHLYTCATDNTVAVWDVPTGTRIKKLKGHASFVNSVSAQPSRNATPVTANALGPVKSSPSSKSGKGTFNVGKTSLSNKKKFSDVRIKKGDMAEFLRRKEMRLTKQPEESSGDEAQSSESSSRLRDIGCQTIESNLSQRLTESTKLTMLYPMKEIDDNEAKMKASGDSRGQRSPRATHSPRRTSDDMMEEKHRSRLNAILDRKDKDPYLPPGYQKGVLPKYLRDRKDSTKEVEDTKADDDNSMCPPGHVTLPDNERKETLRMLRNSFAELVSELNKMPVKTDTLRMRNRKMELEKQLAKLEEGIKVFSRPKVFVKIGE